MEEITIQGESGSFLHIDLIEVYGFPYETCFWGGYEVRAVIEIKSGGFEAYSTLWLSTGELYTFYNSLKECNERLKGEVKLTTSDSNLELVVRYDIQGLAAVTGKFRASDFDGNELQFKYTTDQSYIQATITDLKRIVAKYGDMKGATN
ncbi:phage repressor protein C with HTH and peptisase S24 domain [Hymenobacter luteus]|uniref:Phage repressor protein C with HTH and peptisase S24 domain n=2 Tax=Hymenobacter TaxID=89966 RepID=A0A7W9WC80_9BACT|nr:MULTISPECIES: hypothetical protein [Hymenobacter]MBB4601788.1 phage repressor protein C with HTH and peptisase S24 domain [Hymenobacter latericoloratus]MBB6059783.1 phage repressor protein C with HTH and peptisase S24 domain [Hymenobacter luteus]